MALRCCYMLLLLLPLIAVVSGVDVKKKVGSDALFKPNIPAAIPLKDSSITWKYAGGGDVIKVIEWDNDFKTEESLNPKFKTRVTLDRPTGALTIRDLQLEHTGLYTIEINNKEQEKKITLTVMEGVTKPLLKKEQSGHPNDVMYLTCEGNAKINWTCSGEKNPDITKLEKPRQGELLTFKRAEMPGVCCTCTLFNDVSEETSNQICEKDLFTVSSGTMSGGAIAGIVSFAIFLVSVILFILYLFCDPVYSFVKRYENNSCLKGFIGCLECCRNEIRPQQNDKDVKKGNEHKPMKEDDNHTSPDEECNDM